MVYVALLLLLALVTAAFGDRALAEFLFALAGLGALGVLLFGLARREQARTWPRQ